MQLDPHRARARDGGGLGAGSAQDARARHRDHGRVPRGQRGARSRTAAPSTACSSGTSSGPPEKEPTGEIKSTQVTLEKLVANAGQARRPDDPRGGEVPRAATSTATCPSRTQRTSADWVIKDDLYAVWVTGKKPKGQGWELDAGLKRDTGKWIEVIGKPETIRGVTYIKAVRILLTTPPSATADVKPPPPPPEKPKKPPVVVFALPLDGDVGGGAGQPLRRAVQQGHGREHVRRPRAAALRRPRPARRPRLRRPQAELRPRPARADRRSRATCCGRGGRSS